MKILVNKSYGGYGFTEDFRNRFNLARFDQEKIKNRTRSDIIEAVEDDLTGSFNGEYADIVVVVIPEEATDWLLSDYDGVETIYYVVDGKIHSL